MSKKRVLVFGLYSILAILSGTVVGIEYGTLTGVDMGWSVH